MCDGKRVRGWRCINIEVIMRKVPINLEVIMRKVPINLEVIMRKVPINLEVILDEVSISFGVGEGCGRGKEGGKGVGGS